MFPHLREMTFALYSTRIVFRLNRVIMPICLYVLCLSTELRISGGSAGVGKDKFECTWLSGSMRNHKTIVSDRQGVIGPCKTCSQTSRMRLQQRSDATSTSNSHFTCALE